MDDDAVIRDKLSVEERTLRRIIKKHTLWANCLAKEDLEQARQHYNDIIVELSSYELSLMRFQLIRDMNLKEQQNWIEKKRQIDSEIETTKAEIEALKEEFKAEMKRQNDKTEYDELARSIEQHTPCQDSEEDIKKLDKEIAELERKEKEREQTLERRKGQVQKIMSAISQVQEEIKEERIQSELSIMESEDSTVIPSTTYSPIPSYSSPPPLSNGINGSEQVQTTAIVEENEIDLSDGQNSPVHFHQPLDVTTVQDERATTRSFNDDEVIDLASEEGEHEGGTIDAEEGEHVDGDENGFASVHGSTPTQVHSDSERSRSASRSQSPREMSGSSHGEINGSPNVIPVTMNEEQNGDREYRVDENMDDEGSVQEDEDAGGERVVDVGGDYDDELIEHDISGHRRKRDDDDDEFTEVGHDENDNDSRSSKRSQYDDDEEHSNDDRSEESNGEKPKEVEEMEIEAGEESNGER